MSQIHNNLSRLLEILEAEFKLLQTDNLDGFETLQAEKQVIVEALSEKLTPADIDDDYNVADGDSDDSNVKSMLAMCRDCLLYTSPSPRDMRRSRMPSSA